MQIFSSIQPVSRFHSFKSELGKTSSRNEIEVHHFRFGCRSKRPVRVFVIAGQHGDEPLARDVVNAAFFDASNPNNLSRRLSELPQAVELTVIPDANPDGSEAGIRQNRQGIDLNRDHQSLEANETNLIHGFARAWCPNLIIDLHTFPPRRKIMIRQGVTYLQDVQLDVCNNGSIPQEIVRDGQAMLTDVLNRFRKTSLVASRYTLFRKDGRIRHSTPDVVDARNGLALRCNALSMLIEGRQEARRDSVGSPKQTKQAMTFALYQAIRWLACSNTNAPSLQTSNAVNRSVSIRSKLVARPDQWMLLADSDSGRPIEFHFDDQFMPDVKPTKLVTPPLAYGVPRSSLKVVNLLNRHGFQSRAIVRGTKVEAYARMRSTEPGLAPKKNVSRWTKGKPCQFDPRNYVFYPLLQNPGNALVSFLEPRSKYGLARQFDRFEFPHLVRVT